MTDCIICQGYTFSLIARSTRSTYLYWSSVFTLLSNEHKVYYIPQTEVYLRPSQVATRKLVRDNSEMILAIDFFCKMPHQKFEKFLNTSLLYLQFYSCFWVLWSKIQKQPLADVLQNRCSYKFYNIHKIAPGQESLFNKVPYRPATLSKRDSSTGVFMWMLQDF